MQQSLTKIVQGADGVMIIGNAGVVLRSNDGGQSFQYPSAWIAPT